MAWSAGTTPTTAKLCLGQKGMVNSFNKPENHVGGVAVVA